MHTELGGDSRQRQARCVALGREGHCIVGHLPNVVTAGHAPILEVGHDRGAVDAAVTGYRIDRSALVVQFDELVDVGGGEASEDRV